MANKRISELTTITGANLADADLLVVVDVSDTTMASSGTNKKITMAELAKDSALTDNLIAKTTLTTDGDVLTRAAGAPARITRADLAQDSAFSSRYAPVPDKMWLPATLFRTAGAASYAEEPAGHWNPAWLLDASTIELVSTTVLVPQGWNTFDIYLWWSNAGAGSGDVFLQVNDWTVTTTGTFVNFYNQTVTASARNTIVQTKMNTTAITRVSDVKLLTMRRNGDDAADTLANDIGVNGLMLVKVS